jgi:sugar lactone lactonase YvrE
MYAACILLATTIQPVRAQNYEVTDHLGAVGKPSNNINQPYGMAFDSRGNLWICNTGGHNLVYHNGSSFKMAVGAVNTPGYTDGQGVAIRFSSPKGILITERGGNEIMVVCDAGNNVVRLINISNLTSITSSMAADFTGFNDPSDVEVDAAGNLYVADRQNYVVKKIDAAGTVSIIAGQVGKTGTDDGDALSKAKFLSPTGLYIDGNDIYVADAGAVRKISGGKVSTVSLFPDYDWSFNMGNLFNVTDIEKVGTQWVLSDGCSLRRYQEGTDKFQVMAGSTFANDCGYKTNKRDTFAMFEMVYQMMYVDAEKSLYVADFDNHLIRKVKEIGIGMKPAESLAQVALYPNPAHDKLVVKGLAWTNGGELDLQVVNITGKTVYHKRQITSGDEMVLDVSAFQPGLYLVTLRAGGEISTKKLYIK